MDFRRIHELPPYVFATVDQLKRNLRREGRDVIDLGFGNPDIPSPAIAVAKLQEAAAKPANHRYSASRGITQLRLALTEHYERSFGVALDPETPVTTTIGAKEGLAHPMWVPGGEVELYSLTKSFSMAGWRVGFAAGRADVIGALTKLKSYLDYGTFQPIQIAATVTLREASDYPAEICDIYRGRRDALIRGLGRAGW